MQEAMRPSLRVREGVRDLTAWMLIACLALLLAAGNRGATAPPGPEAP